MIRRRVAHPISLLLLAAVAGCSGGAGQNGALPLIIGSRGHGLGTFSHPRGIDVAPDGRIAVADRTGRIQILRPDGAPILQWDMPKMDNGTPTGIVFDATDPTSPTLLVADTHNSRIMRYSTDGALLKMFGEFGGAPGQMIYPTDLTVNAKGEIFITEYGENDRVMVYDREGRFERQFGGFGTEPGKFQRPLGLVWFPPSTIIVADSCNHRVQIFDEVGTLKKVFGESGDAPGQMNYPYDLAVDAKGRIFIIEFGSQRIQCFDMDGKLLGVYGSAGAAPGRFAAPWGLSMDAPDRLIAADTGNHRLQVIPSAAILTARQ